MKKNIKLRGKAIALRKKGLSYGEIKKQIPIAKSSLSLWLKGIPLKPEHKARLYTKRIQVLARGPASQKERRMREVEVITKKASEEIQIPLSPETHRLMGACLYWAEGSKGKMVQMTNSDPHLIVFMVDWIEKMFKISRKTLKASLNIYPQQNDQQLKKFWSDLTGIPLNNFRKSYIKPPSKNFKKNNLYYGTMRIEMPKSANARYIIFGWIQGAIKDSASKVDFTQRKWHHLRQVTRPINID